MTGAGTAFGAVTVLNATATGRGCALAVRDGVRATWDWDDGDGLRWRGDVDDRLARACHALAAARFGRRGATASTTAPWPPSRGLKTSSGAATALLRAAADAAGQAIPDAELEHLAVDAALEAGVTLTGAYDDQVATVRGGCHLTDNRTRSILRAIPVPSWYVAVWVPEASIAKSTLSGLVVDRLAHRLEGAERMLADGDVPGALTLNGAVFLGFYEAAGLPVTDAPVRVALEYDALGAGLSGTGPAVAALFDEPVPLPDVAGGAWKWTQVQGAVA